MRNLVLMLSLAALIGCSDEPVVENPASELETAGIVAPASDIAEASTSADTDYYCTPQEAMTPICGFKASPEDAEWLPDGSGLIVSELVAFGTGSREGRISLVNHQTGEISLLYDASMQDPENDKNTWGAQGVTSKSSFSPHGISLSQRGDGRWQLLVVNHAHNAQEETIDMFELLKVDGAWTLQWRGGVDGEDDDFYNDVDVAGTGFYATRYFKGELENLFVDYTQKLKNGIVKKWTPETGWIELSGTAGISLNGILWNEPADELVVAEWGNATVNVFTGDGTKKYAIKDIPYPDNISWNEAGDAYLVASKSTGLQQIAECGAKGEEVCEGEFNIFQIQSESGLKTTRFNSDGKFWGPPSNAVEKDGKLYIGSFGGSRLLIVE